MKDTATSRTAETPVSNGKLPMVSVILPTRDAGDSCRRLLDSLSEQTLAPCCFEVIVVVDGDRRIAEDVLNLRAAFRLSFVRQAPRGRAAARNRGAAQASTPFLVFLDDDMVADPDLLSAYLSSYAASPDGIFLGYFPLPEVRGPESGLTHLIRRFWEDQFARRADHNYSPTYRDLCTGSLALARNLFWQAGGFDEAMGRGIAGEDWEFGYRAILRGNRLIYTPGAISTHYATTTLRHFFNRARENARGALVMLKAHPELFHELPTSQIHRSASRPAARPLWRLLWQFPGIVLFSSHLIRFLNACALFLFPRAGFKGLLNCGYALSYFEALQAALGSRAAWDLLARKGSVPPRGSVSAVVAAKTEACRVASVTQAPR